MRSKRQEFSKRVRLQAWERCGGRCECGCGCKIIGTPVYDHFPLRAALGGPGTLENCRVLDPKCNRRITYEKDIPEVAAAIGKFERRIGARIKRGRPMPGSSASGYRKRMDGTVERR